jgi:hypothetical protein
MSRQTKPVRKPRPIDLQREASGEENTPLSTNLTPQKTFSKIQRTRPPDEPSLLNLNIRFAWPVAPRYGCGECQP